MTMTTGVPDQHFEVRDNQRTLTFTGVSLARSSSQSGSDLRWTELSLFRTTSGRYVVEKIGRSDVFHSPRCRRRNKGDRYNALSDVHEVKEFVSCPDCNPSQTISPVYVERDFYQAGTHETAAELVYSFQRHDSGGVPYISKVARVLLDAAARLDANIARELNTSVDVT
jgi:hypothetical protein